MIRCGVDPGVTGGIAFLGDGKIIATFPMPVDDWRADGEEVARLLRMYVPEEVIIEQTQPMPKNGAIAGFKLGYNTGLVEGVVTSLRHPLVRIRPQDWKKENGLIGKPKAASLGLAKNLWPELHDVWRLRKNDGQAEAALIVRGHVLRTVKEANHAPVPDR